MSELTEPVAPARRSDEPASRMPAWLVRLPFTRLQRTMLVLLVGAILVLDSLFIPFHAADDEDHFAIASAAAHFHFMPVPAPDPSVSSGNYVDAALPGVIRRNYHAVRLEARPDIGRTPWAGREVYFPIPASVYLPLAYLPQMLAIRAGEAVGATIETTIYAARVTNGLTALAIIAVALAFLPEAVGLFVLVLLSLPKSLQVFASNSADPVIHALTIALMAFVWSALKSERGPRPWHYGLAGLALLTLAGIRPPLAALGLPLAYAALHRRSGWGLAAAVGGVALAGAWWKLVLPIHHDLRLPVTGAFADKVMVFATHWPVMIYETLAQRGLYYWFAFIGELGYGNAGTGAMQPLPLFVYPVAMAVLALAFAALGDARTRLPAPAPAVFGLTAIAVAFGVFFTMALGCTSLGETVIVGVQGRYFMTAVLLAAMAAATGLPRATRAREVLVRVMPAFLAFNFAVMAAAGFRLYWSA